MEYHFTPPARGCVVALCAVAILFGSCVGAVCECAAGEVCVDDACVANDAAQRVWPVSASATPDLPQSSPFGPRQKASEDFRYDYHRGVDIPTPLNTPLVAIADGVVRINGTHDAYSDGVVQIIHENWAEAPGERFYATYLHIVPESVPVHEGQVVRRGDVVAYSGESVSGFAHLHFEVRARGLFQKDCENVWTYLPFGDTARGHWGTVASRSGADVTVDAGSYSGAELDFNAIRLVALAGGSVVFEKSIDFQQLNHDVPSVAALDEPLQDGVLIAPGRFTSSSAEQPGPEYTFTFRDVPQAASAAFLVEATDVHGHVVRSALASAHVGNLAAAYEHDAHMRVLAPSVVVTRYGVWPAMHVTLLERDGMAVESEVWMDRAALGVPIGAPLRVVDADTDAVLVRSSTGSWWTVAIGAHAARTVRVEEAVCEDATTCSGHGTCAAGPGAGCECASGWRGAACDECAPGHFGPQCAACPATCAHGGMCPSVPTIVLSSVPALGETSDVTGTVYGVANVTDYMVAPVIRVGTGWWSKPTAVTHVVPIAADGTFTADVTTGGGDTMATHLRFFVVRADDASIPVVLGEQALPAALVDAAVAERDHVRGLLEFSGYVWRIKEHDTPVGPGPNRFSGDVYADDDGLHLFVRQDEHGQWHSTEVVLDGPRGYGTYEFVAEGDGYDDGMDDIDPNLVLGAFTWDNSSGDEAHRELDFEFARWGNADFVTNAQFVFQPHTTAGNLQRYTVPANERRVHCRMVWGETTVAFTTMAADGSTIFEWETPQSKSPGNAEWRFNFWAMDGNPPSDATRTHRVRITSFSHTPLDGASAAPVAGEPAAECVCAAPFATDCTDCAADRFGAECELACPACEDGQVCAAGMHGSGECVDDDDEASPAAAPASPWRVLCAVVAAVVCALLS